MESLLNVVQDLTKKVEELNERMNGFNPQNQIWDFEDVAEFLKCSVSTVKHNYKKWGIPHKKLGKSVYFKPFTWDDLSGDVFDPKGLLKKHRMRQVLSNW